ncbi:hypothetical protein [Aequorivita marina]|nr:hypothetical protein [Aequorivita sp. S2608]MDS1297129.1 hypothetical protein [Aequorivita sp. S2608]
MVQHTYDYQKPIRFNIVKSGFSLKNRVRGHATLIINKTNIAIASLY